MLRYRTSTPRFAFGIAAAAMMAATMGIMVVAPATIEAGAREATMLAAPEIAPAVLRGAIASSPLAVAALYQPWFEMAEARHMKRNATPKAKPN